jgi:hypothetical protein
MAKLTSLAIITLRFKKMQVLRLCGSALLFDLGTTCRKLTDLAFTSLCALDTTLALMQNGVPFIRYVS